MLGIVRPLDSTILEETYSAVTEKQLSKLAILRVVGPTKLGKTQNRQLLRLKNGNY